MFTVAYKAEISGDYTLQTADSILQFAQGYGRGSLQNPERDDGLRVLRADIRDESLWRLGRLYSEVERELQSYDLLPEVEIVEEDGAVIVEGDL